MNYDYPAQNTCASLPPRSYRRGAFPRGFLAKRTRFFRRSRRELSRPVAGLAREPSLCRRRKSDGPACRRFLAATRRHAPVATSRRLAFPERRIAGERLPFRRYQRSGRRSPTSASLPALSGATTRPYRRVEFARSASSNRRLAKLAYRRQSRLRSLPSGSRTRPVRPRRPPKSSLHYKRKSWRRQGFRQ